MYNFASLENLNKLNLEDNFPAIDMDLIQIEKDFIRETHTQENLLDWAIQALSGFLSPIDFFKSLKEVTYLEDLAKGKTEPISGNGLKPERKNELAAYLRKIRNEDDLAMWDKIDESRNTHNWSNLQQFYSMDLLSGLKKEKSRFIMLEREKRKLLDQLVACDIDSLYKKIKEVSQTSYSIGFWYASQFILMTLVLKNA